MTKPVQVIFCRRQISLWLVIFVNFFFLFFAAEFSRAEYLLRPVADSSQPTQLVIVSEQNNVKPQVSFGDLLNGTTPTPIQMSSNSGSLSSTTLQYYSNQQSDTIATRSANVKALLAQLESSYYESQKQLREFNRQNNLQPTTYSLQLDSTPYIPIPTFMAGIHEIVSNNPKVLGDQDTSDGARSTSPRWIELNQSATNLPAQTSNPQPTTITVTPTPKSNYVVAVLGDSMVDTMGRDLPHLNNLLKKNYPKYSFVTLNYGQGATDLESGLKRLTNYSEYLGESFAPLLSFKPDILVVESFAYNHWSGQQTDLDRQWLTVAKIIDTIRANSPDSKIILAAAISPDANTFGDGKLDWPMELKWQAALTTKAYLQNIVNFATSQHFPLADAYHASMKSDGMGFSHYINQGDHIHPSSAGALLFSQKIVEAIKSNHLLPD